MRAAVILEQGALPKLVDFEEPVARPGCEVVEILIAAIGPTDRMKANGDTRPYPGSHIVNGEGVGLRSNGTKAYFGHSVVPFGACAERTLVASDEIWDFPVGVSDEQAAALCISATGALIALEQAAIRPGERVLVLGATGVLGQAGLQIARSMSPGRVVAAGRNRATLSQIAENGLADEVAYIGDGDDLGSLRKSSAEGFDVILDVVYGPPAEAAIKTLRPGGRMMSVGRLAGTTINLPLQDIGYRGLFGVGTGIRPAEERHAAFDRLMRLAADGKLSIDTRRFPMERCAEAWEALGHSANVKILLDPPVPT